MGYSTLCFKKYLIVIILFKNEQNTIKTIVFSQYFNLFLHAGVLILEALLSEFASFRNTHKEQLLIAYL